MNGGNRMRRYSSGTEGSEEDYGYTHNQEFLVTVEQKHGDKCVRCVAKVYPTEKVEVGVQLHKNCFRCRECSLTLTLNSFVLAKYDVSGRKDVFCKSHAPKLDKNQIDPESIPIKGALTSQQVNKRQSFNAQVRLGQQDTRGWQYDPQAVEFEHAKALQHRNRLPRPKTHDASADDLDYEQGGLIQKLRSGLIERTPVKSLASSLAEVIGSRHPKADPPPPAPPAPPAPPQPRTHPDPPASKFPQNQDYMAPNALWSPQRVEDPWHPRYLGNSADQMLDQSGQNYENVSRDLHSNNNHGNRNGYSQHQTQYQPPQQSRDNRSSGYYGDLDPVYGGGNPQSYPNGHNMGRYQGNEKIYERLNVRRSNQVMPDSAAPRRHMPPLEVTRGSHQDRGNEYFQDCRPYDYMCWDRDLYPVGPPYDPYATVERYSTLAARRARPRLPYPGSREFLKEKVFAAQTELERRQRHEHDQMIRDFEVSREHEIVRLESEVKHQADLALQELFMQMDSGNFQGDTNVEKMRIEERFQRLKEEKMRLVMSDLTLEERMRIDDMIDRQTQEMLQIIDQKVPAKLPEPRPPHKRKKQLFTSSNIFDEVDFHVVQVARYELGSFTELVHELTRHCKSQMEKVRAIFKWLTVKDLSVMMFSEELEDDSPYFFLSGIKYGLESYHELFKRLCSYVGLPVKIIRGLSKSAGYRPGMPLGDSRFRNSWAVVHLDGNWRFVDCHWGARHVSAPTASDDPQDFCYEVDEFYFLTDPEDIIYMHFPDDAEWQLVQTSLSLEEFVNLPVVKSHFFQYALKFSQSQEAVIDTDNGKVEVVLKSSGKLPLAYSTRLSADDQDIDGYCIHHFQGKEIIFNLCLPRKGVFFFSIFAGDRDKSDAHSIVCSFRLKCVHVQDRPFCRFPRLPDGYGPTPMADELGMKADKYNEYYLVCMEEKMVINIKFACPVRVSQKLIGCDDDAAVRSVTKPNHPHMDRLVFQRFKDHTVISFLLRFPARGIYLFSIFAGYKESASQSLDCACRYLIQCNVNPSTAIRPFPKTLQCWQKCRLIEPTMGDLRINKNVKFKLEVINADAVAVIVGTQWFYLQRVDDTSRVWEGVAHTGKDPKLTADVYARQRENERDFFPLLEYKLLDED